MKKKVCDYAKDGECNNKPFAEIYYCDDPDCKEVPTCKHKIQWSYVCKEHFDLLKKSKKHFAWTEA